MLNEAHLRTLQHSKIFKGIDEKYLSTLLDLGGIQTFNPNDIIIEENQIEHPLYIIMEGEVEIFLPRKQQG